jgi:hypothetical protein
VAAEIVAYGLADLRKRVTEGDKAMVFRFVAHFAKAFVVAILLTPARRARWPANARLP